MMYHPNQRPLFLADQMHRRRERLFVAAFSHFIAAGSGFVAGGFVFHYLWS